MADENKTNVLLWVPRFWPAMGGTELHTREMGFRLSEDHHVNLITHSTTSERSGYSLEQDANDTTNDSYMHGPISVNRVPMNPVAKPVLAMLAGQYRRFKLVRLAYSCVFVSSLYRRTAVLTNDTDLIHFIYNGLTDSAILAAVIARRGNVPFVFTPNILDTSDRKHAWNSTRFKCLYRFSSRIIALTTHEADWLVTQNVPREKISIVPYGPILEGNPDGSRFRQIAKTGDAKVVLFLSRIVALKGYKLLLDACEAIWSAHPNTQVVFMGPATPESRSDILKSDDPRIVLMEEFDQRTKADALTACDLLCVPSRKESLGVVYIEAAFNAKPVVALNLPVLHDVINHDVDGFLVDESARSVASAVISLLDDPAKCDQMGRRGQAKAMQKYDWTTVRKNINKVYSDVLCRNGQ